MDTEMCCTQEYTYNTMRNVLHRGFQSAGLDLTHNVYSYSVVKKVHIIRTFKSARSSNV